MTLEQATQTIIAALTVWREARNQSIEAQQGVASVILNRAKQGHWGGGVWNVCTKYGQFSSINWFKRTDSTMVETYSDTLAWPKENDSVWQDCLKIARDVLVGELPDNTEGAVFYHDSSLEEPPSEWGSVTKTVQLDALTFYKQ